MDQINRAEQQGLIYQTDITSKSIFTFDDIHRMNYEQFNSISKSAGNDLFHPRMVSDDSYLDQFQIKNDMLLMKNQEIKGKEFQDLTAKELLGI